MVLVARKELPANNLQEFIAYARENQASMQYGSAGTGSTGHVDCALLNTAIGVKIAHVPYRGGGPAMQDLIAGRIDYFCTLSATIVPQIESKLVNPIAIFTGERLPAMPNVATAREQGFGDFEASTWFGFFLPARTPEPISQKLHDATIAAMKTESVRERFVETGTIIVQPERRSSEYLRRFVVSEIEKNAGPIRAAGISMD